MHDFYVPGTTIEQIAEIFDSHLVTSETRYHKRLFRTTTITTKTYEDDFIIIKGHANTKKYSRPIVYVYIKQSVEEYPTQVLACSFRPIYDSRKGHEDQPAEVFHPGSWMDYVADLYKQVETYVPPEFQPIEDTELFATA